MQDTREGRPHVGDGRQRGLRRILGLAVGAVALVACGKGRDADDVPALAVTDTAAVSPDAVPITDIVAIVTVPDRMPLVGRRVTLTDMKVLTVTGPNAFWVGPSPDQQLFVVRGGTAASDSTRVDSTRVDSTRVDSTQPGTTTGSSATGPEVRAGQTVSVSGIIRQLPADLGAVRSAWSLSTANEATLTRERVYLDADRVDVTGR